MKAPLFSACALLLLVASPPDIAAQRIGEPAITPAPLVSPQHLRPQWTTRRLNGGEVFRVGALSASLSVTSGFVGGGAGLLIGYTHCVERERDGSFSAFTCFFLNKGIMYGTYTGTFLGAGLGAGTAGIRYGCAARDGWRRGFGGALAGTLPALVYLAAGGSNSVDVQNGMAIMTPVLQIAGATAAVSRCRVLTPRR